ncbi:putative phage tail component-like protein [Desulfitispora alkaliphila]|uniref:distal tail protein Dit n=1 Tax=Desulfitispora alkaliphila TaxID=622674 RepID=UPI003D19508D
MLKFSFGGKNSFSDYGIVIATRPTIPSPKRRVNHIDIPGRNSSIRYDEKTYEDTTILVECALKSSENLLGKIDEIKAWLFNAGENDLIFSFQPEKKYIAQVVNAINFTQVFKYTSKFPIVFNCRPFKYAVLNQPLNITESGASINNPGTLESLPIISVYGLGDINLIINDRQIELTDVDNKIIINSEIEDCYDDGFNNLNSKMNGAFPTLKIGQNIIQWTGNVEEVEVLPNWRWL